MARIEGEGFNNAGKVREWFARSVHAARDPAWTADGIVAEQWAPVSPVSGRLDAFEWRVPFEALEKPEAALITQRMEEMARLGATAALPEPDGGEPDGDEPTTIEPIPLRRATSIGKSADDWLHDNDADTGPGHGNGRPINGSHTPLSSKRTSTPAAVPSVKTSDAYLHAPDLHAPDDPGTEPLDANRSKSQLERYRLIGAKT